MATTALFTRSLLADQSKVPSCPIKMYHVLVPRVSPLLFAVPSPTDGRNNTFGWLFVTQQMRDESERPPWLTVCDQNAESRTLHIHLKVQYTISAFSAIECTFLTISWTMKNGSYTSCKIYCTVQRSEQ